jgi:hypothetical protein
MELALQGLQWQICLIYLHGVVIFSKTFDEHMERLTRVFDRISTAGLKLNCLRWWPLFNFQNIGRVRSNSLTRDNMSKESNFSL